MKIVQIHSVTQPYALLDKRFSIKEFFKIVEPETVHWNKLNEEDANCILASTQDQKKNDELVKSIVRGMTNTIELQVLDELQ